MPLLALHDLTKRYPAVGHGPRGAEPRARARDHRPGRRQRRGQEHAAQDPARAASSRPRARPRCMGLDVRGRGHDDPPVRRLYARVGLPAAGRDRHGLRQPHGADVGAAAPRPRASARPRSCATSGCTRSATAPIGGYSTGMKQRVKLAQALVHDPRLLLLDEPTNGLDPAGRDEMLALVRRTGTEFGIAVIVASHLLGEIERVCDFLVAIDGGRLLRAAPLGAFTERTGCLAVEVEEGEAAARGRPLAERGLQAGRRRPDLADRHRRRPAVRRGPRRRSRTSACRWCAWSSAGAASRTCSATEVPAAPTRRRATPPRSAAMTDRARSVERADHRPVRAAASTTWATRATTGPRLGRRTRSRVAASRRRCAACYGIGRGGRAKVAPFALLGAGAAPARSSRSASRRSRAQAGAAASTQASPIKYATYQQVLIVVPDAVLRGAGARAVRPRPALPRRCRCTSRGR